MNHNADEEPQNIHHHMTFYAFDLFAGVVTGAFGPGIGFDRLRIDNER